MEETESEREEGETELGESDGAQLAGGRQMFSDFE